MKYFQGFVLFFFIGLFIAFMIGPGDNYYRKKSEQVGFSVEIYLMFGVVGGLIGIGVGASWEEDEKKHQKFLEEQKIAFELQQKLQKERQIKADSFGLNNLTDISYKDGRKWIFETTWVNPISKNLNTIKTCFYGMNKITVTLLNDDILYNHNSSEGSKVFIEKNHAKYKRIIIDDIIDGKIFCI